MDGKENKEEIKKVFPCPYHSTLNDNIMKIIENQIEFDEKYEKDKYIMVCNGDETKEKMLKDDIIVELRKDTKSLRINNRIKKSLKEWWNIHPIKTKIIYAIISLIMTSILTWATTRFVSAVENIFDTNSKTTAIIPQLDSLKAGQTNILKAVDTIGNKQNNVIIWNTRQDEDLKQVKIKLKIK